MVFTFDNSKAQRYEVSLEAHEMGEDESRPLQSAMAEEWGTVLRQRVVASLGVARSARSRSVQIANRSASIRAKLGVPEPVPQYSPMLGRRKVWSCPIDSVDEGSSEDESLVRRVRAREASERGDSDEEGKSDEGEDSSEGSDCESGSQAEEEREQSSEEESESDSGEESGDDDDIIYMRRESAPTLALRKSLMSQFYSRA